MANGITSARMPTLMFVPCRIQRGGFSSERTFEIREGDKSSMGTADVDYLRDGSWNHLDEDEPDENVVIEGYVQCKVLRTIGDDQVLIEVPGAKTVYATKADIVAPD